MMLSIFLEALTLPRSVCGMEEKSAGFGQFLRPAVVDAVPWPEIACRGLRPQAGRSISECWLLFHRQRCRCHGLRRWPLNLQSRARVRLNALESKINNHKGPSDPFCTLTDPPTAKAFCSAMSIFHARKTSAPFGRLLGSIETAKPSGGESSARNRSFRSRCSNLGRKTANGVNW